MICFGIRSSFLSLFGVSFCPVALCGWSCLSERGGRRKAIGADHKKSRSFRDDDILKCLEQFCGLYVHEPATTRATLPKVALVWRN